MANLNTNPINVVVRDVVVNFNVELYNKAVNFGLNEGLIEQVEKLERKFGSGLLYDEALMIFEPKDEDVSESSFTDDEKYTINFVCNQIEVGDMFEDLDEETPVKIYVQPEVEPVESVVEEVQQEVESVVEEVEPEVEPVKSVVEEVQPEVQPELNIVIPEIKIENPIQQEIQPEVQSVVQPEVQQIKPIEIKFGVLDIEIPKIGASLGDVKPITPVINKVEKPIPKQVETKIEPEVKYELPKQVGNLVIPDLSGLLSPTVEKVSKTTKTVVQGVQQVQQVVAREKIELNQSLLSLFLGMVAAAMATNGYNPDVTGETMSLDLIANKAAILSKINRSKNAVATLGRTFDNPEIEVYIMSDQLGWLVFTSGNHIIVMDNNFNGSKMNLITCELVPDPTNIHDPVVKTIVSDFTKYVKTFKKNGGHVPGATAWK